MANPHRGEAQLKVGETTYTLVFNTNAIAAAEMTLDMGVGDIMKRLDRVYVMQAVLWACLKERHKEFAAPEDVGALTDTAGAEAVGAAVTQALLCAFPPPEPGAARKNR